MANQPGETADAGSGFFRGTFDETMDLLIEARNYMRHCERRERKRLGNMGGLRLNCEAMRVTSRLTQVMAWLMVQKAVYAGELTPEQALAEERRLTYGDVCMDRSAEEDTSLPSGFRSLMDRSWQLFARVERLEQLIMRRIRL